jgi:2-aminoethylphosphonate-pyruvate transaminase
LQAVILAAGLGSRLRPFTDFLPKSLLVIKKKSLIEHSLAKIKANGINDVVIVIGYLGHEIIEKLKKWKDMNISFIENKDYARTGTMESFRIAGRIVYEDILLIEGDIYYENNCIKYLLETNDKDVTLVRKYSGSDEILVWTDKKNNLKKLVRASNDIERQEAYGEMVGISKLSIEYSKQLWKCNKENYWDSMLSISRDYPVKCLYKDIETYEIDTVSDYYFVKNVIESKKG